MSVQASVKAGFWTSLWRALTGGLSERDSVVPADPTIIAPALTAWALTARAIETLATEKLAPETPGPATGAPIALDASVSAPSRFGSGVVFGLSARLASTQSLNSPVQRREGKAAVVPRDLKVVQGVKAKPKAAAAIVKKSQPSRHVWLSSRPQPHKSADIIKFVPRSQRASAVRAA